ncbi:MAG: hypothetical protein JW893_03515 [Candidatus Omnitrophica bacterium]|nr:hypothetical protein [Candidatus Omnitrophota bacterium]
MKKKNSLKRGREAILRAYSNLIIWPLIVMGGKLVFRVVLNLWNMIEG